MLHFKEKEQGRITFATIEIQKTEKIVNSSEIVK